MLLRWSSLEKPGTDVSFHLSTFPSPAMGKREGKLCQQVVNGHEKSISLSAKVKFKIRTYHFPLAVIKCPGLTRETSEREGLF